MLNARMVVNENGLYELIRYDDSAAPLKSWTADEITDFKVLSNYENLRNRVHARGAKMGGRNTRHALYSSNDALSQANNSVPGTVREFGIDFLFDFVPIHNRFHADTDFGGIASPAGRPLRHLAQGQTR